MQASSRRELLLAALPFAVPELRSNPLTERFGVMCNLDVDELAARKVLASARQAGFRQIQVKFPWAKVNNSYLKALPAWIRSEGLETQALGAYVNCCDPNAVLMDARPEHLTRAIQLAGDLNCHCLVAWTGGYSSNMAIADRRNWLPQAEDSICRFLASYIPDLERSALVLALESYITLACPDAPSLRRTLDRLPNCIGAVLDPPNLTPMAQYAQRDHVLREMATLLRSRIAIVHMKDFRLNAAGESYELPGPLEGEMNYMLFLKIIRSLPTAIPLIAEHVAPGHFASTRARLLTAAKALPR